MQLYNMSFRPCELTSSIFIISVELEVMIHDSLIKGLEFQRTKHANLYGVKHMHTT